MRCWRLIVSIHSLLFRQAEIVLGTGSVVESMATITCKKERPVICGDFSVFSAGCLCEDSLIGSGVIVGEKAELRNCTLVGGNVVVAGLKLTGQVLEQDVCAFRNGEGNVVFEIVKGATEKQLAQNQLYSITIGKIVASSGKLRK